MPRQNSHLTTLEIGPIRRRGLVPELVVAVEVEEAEEEGMVEAVAVAVGGSWVR